MRCANLVAKSDRRPSSAPCELSGCARVVERRVIAPTSTSVEKATAPQFQAHKGKDRIRPVEAATPVTVDETTDGLRIEEPARVNSVLTQYFVHGGPEFALQPAAEWRAEVSMA